MPANFSMDMLEKYSDFKPDFVLVSRALSANGVLISEYESPSPIRDHEYHFQVKENASGRTGRYSFV